MKTWDSNDFMILEPWFQKYSQKAQKGEQIALFSNRISFIHPTKKESMIFSLAMPKRYPWSEFHES